MKKKPAPTSVTRRILNYLMVISAIIVLAGVLLAPVGNSLALQAREGAACSVARQIGQLLFSYSVDHDGHYPEGKTSTEVFQKLLDGKYADDPVIFYIAMPGKIPPQGNRLKAENVGWDLPYPIDPSVPDNLPVVFMTGYKITYQAGAKAILVDQSPRTWEQWWNGPDIRKMFLAAFVKGNNAWIKRPDKDGSIPNFIPADFDPKGKTYRQLTP